MSDTKKPEEILDVNRRWLPPSPHLEKVIEAVQSGAAVIEKRGHGEPPLLVFEDGGVIELPKARHEPTYRGLQIVSADEGAKPGRTKYRDVCGSVDYLKDVLLDNPELVKTDPDRLHRILDDALYMIERMYKREDEYRNFLVEIAAICAQPPRGPDPAMATHAAEEIRMLLHDHSEDVTKYIELLNRLAEDVRHVASNQEQCLARYKELALRIRKLYEDIKGARNWEDTPEGV
jgi:hypothetical protein